MSAYHDPPDPARRSSWLTRAVLLLCVVVVALVAAVVLIQREADDRITALKTELDRQTANEATADQKMASEQASQAKRLTSLEKDTGALSSQISDAKHKIADQAKAIQLTVSKLPADWQDIVKKTLPSVVQVVCTPPSSDVAYSGSGFAVKLPTPAPTGYTTAILTNEHVVEQCTRGSTDEVEVSKNEQKWPAELVNTARDDTAATDVALLYIPVALPTLPTGTVPAEGAEVGALGNPLEFADVFTRGTVSKDWDDGWIQHTAALNHGNSGGPLLDSQGRVVGINTSSIEEDPNGQPVHDSYFAEPLSSACQVVAGACPFH